MRRNCTQPFRHSAARPPAINRLPLGQSPPMGVLRSKAGRPSSFGGVNDASGEELGFSTPSGHLISAALAVVLVDQGGSSPPAVTDEGSDPTNDTPSPCRPGGFATPVNRRDGVLRQT
jgi:hypothetical protein